MNVSLTPALEKYVASKVKSGLYQTASEVVREGLRLLRERDQEGRRKLEDLRREINIGIEQADQGLTVPINEATLERIRARAKKRLSKRK